MTERPLVRRFGDAAVLVQLGEMSSAIALRSAVQAETRAGRLPLADELVLGDGSLTVVLDPERESQKQWLDALGPLAAAAGGDSDDWRHREPTGDEVEVAVCFDGADLDTLSAEIGWEPASVIDALVEAKLQVAFLGFSPGFAYLRGLPVPLANVARRDRPRPAVPAGSLAIGGGFAAFYPQSTPCGWHLVGRTNVVLFDPDRPPHALLAPGQRIRLVPTTQLGPAPTRPSSASSPSAGVPALQVERPGLCTVVEDLGRIGVAELGVPRAGAFDLVALRLANRLVGNGDHDAALEATVTGPRLRALTDVLVAVVGDPWCPGGVEVTVDGHVVPEGEVVPLRSGQALDVGKVAAVRAVVAVAGGLDLPAVLGSRSSDTLSGLGKGPLVPGSVMAVGHPGRPRGHLSFTGASPPEATAPEVASLRVLPGPDVADGAAAESLLAGRWVAEPDSNRVGIRLGPAGSQGRRRPAELTPARSRGMVLGAVQLPPDGGPIILGPDHATVGGYPIVAVVISADLPRLAHIAPGQIVCFDVVPDDAATAARLGVRSALAKAVTGWFPTQAG